MCDILQMHASPFLWSTMRIRSVGNRLQACQWHVSHKLNCLCVLITCCIFMRGFITARLTCARITHPQQGSWRLIILEVVLFFLLTCLFFFFPGWNKLSWFISCQIITASFDQHLSYSNSPSVRHESTFARNTRVIQKLLPDQQERWLVQNQFSKQNHKKKIVLDGHWKNKFHFRHLLPLHFPTVFCRFGFV